MQLIYDFNFFSSPDQLISGQGMWSKELGLNSNLKTLYRIPVGAETITVLDTVAQRPLNLILRPCKNYRTPHRLYKFLGDQVLPPYWQREPST